MKLTLTIGDWIELTGGVEVEPGKECEIEGTYEMSYYPYEIFLMGPEGSGNHMVRRLLTYHPWVPKTRGSSYPHGIPEVCEYPTLKEHDPETTIVVLITRDVHCQQASCLRRRFYQHREEVLGIEKAKLFNDIKEVQTVIRNQLSEWKGRVVWCSYEAMVLWKAVYLRHILNQLELDPSIYPWEKVGIVDGNEKYFRNPIQ